MKLKDLWVRINSRQRDIPGEELNWGWQTGIIPGWWYGRCSARLMAFGGLLGYPVLFQDIRPTLRLNYIQTI